MSGRHSAGKGDKYRPVDYKKYAENYDKIFPKKVKGGKNGTEASLLLFRCLLKTNI